MTATKSVSVHRYCVQKLGVHRGAIAAARVAQWAITTDELGHVPTTVEYAEWWSVDERTGWRHRALIQEALGGEWASIVTRIAVEAGRRRARSPRAVQRLELAL